jgi:Ca2+/H+ antiporter, TMEM165/GDT1 family
MSDFTRLACPRARRGYAARVSAADVGLLLSTFAAAFVECVEALTIVLAMAVTRGWRSALAGTATALVALAVFTIVAGAALVRFVSPSALQLVVGSLMLVFGLQWLRKAILRAAGRKSLHDEEAEYAAQTQAGQTASAATFFGLDAFGYVVSFKAVLLEGIEVTFIVVTFGVNADNLPLAASGGAAAAVVVLLAGALLHRPLTAVPENTLKYVVGLLLATFGTFWSLEGLGVLTGARESLVWPGGDVALLALLLGWVLWSRLLIRVLREPATPHVEPESAQMPT